MTNLQDYLTEMSLRRPDGLRDLLGSEYLRIPDFFDDDHSTTVQQLNDYAAKFGWKKLGQGHHGAVYGHDKYDWCIKVFSDDVYLSWIKYCKARPRNVYLPKFRGNVIPLKWRGHTSGGIVRVEKLAPISHKGWMDLIKAMEEIQKDKVWQEGDPDLYELSTLLRQVAKSGRFMGQRAFPDVHQGNFMLRGRTEVFIDPFASEQSDSYNYNK